MPTIWTPYGYIDENVFKRELIREADRYDRELGYSPNHDNNYHKELMDRTARRVALGKATVTQSIPVRWVMAQLIDQNNRLSRDEKDTVKKLLDMWEADMK